jgi:glycosyltransferase involved in cell wall biosynthesis
MKISVIITTYNRPVFLRLALAGYMAQTDRDFEILVADDGSGPETAAAVAEFAGEADFAVRHVWHEDRGFRKTAILNRAIAAAKGEYLMFTDGDLIARNDLVAVHRRFARPGHYAVGAYNRLPAATTSAVTRETVARQDLFRMSWLLAHGYRPTRGFLRIVMPRTFGPALDRLGEAGRGRFPGGHAACFKRDADAVGGFDERMTYGSEDREFGTRLCNLGIEPLRIKNSTFMMHLEHDRPYQNAAEAERNLAILRETETTGRIVAGHLAASR